MAIYTYRYGEATHLPGLSIGTTRHLPRGIKRSEYASRGYFEVWLPTLAPTGDLLSAYLHGEITFARFASRYRREMKQPEARHTLRLVAAVARRQRVNLGCFCKDPATCHRTILAQLLAAEGAPLGADEPETRPRYASPACSMPEIED